MTTIAYSHKLKQVAVDSRFTIGGQISTDKGSKTIKDDKGVWVLCGAKADYSHLISLNHDDKPDVPPDCSAFLIAGDGVYHVVVNDGYCVYEKLDGDLAIGSGGDYALAAMDFGKSAKKAVKYAMTRDVYTGGRVKVFNV